MTKDPVELRKQIVELKKQVVLRAEEDKIIQRELGKLEGQLEAALEVNGEQENG